MRNILIALSLAVLSAWTISDNNKDVLGVEGPLTYNGVVFELSEVEKVDSVTTLQTYKPKKNSEYTETLYIKLNEETDSAREMIAAKVLELVERKAFDFFCDYAVSEAPNGKEFILNYQEVFQKMNEPSKVVFNCSHYASIALPDGTPAVMIYGYSRQYITTEIKKTIQKVDEIKPKCINAMKMDSKPRIKKK